MKRIFSFLLALLMVCNLAVPAMAVEVPTEANTFYLDVDKTSVKVGDTVTLSVYSNTEMTDMMSNSVLIDYDETVFRLDLENSSVTGNSRRWGIIDNTHESVGKYTGTSMYHSDSEVTIPNGLLATIQFTALAASDDASFEIFLTDASWFNWDDNTKNNIDVKFAGPIAMTVTAAQEEEPEGSVIPADAPFTALTTDQGDVLKVELVESVSFTGYNTYENVPYYHVTIPAGTTSVYVTHPAAEDPFADAGYGSAYGYYAETSGWTGGGMTYSYEDAEDGYTITLPVSSSATDWNTGETTEMSFVADETGYVGYAVGVERNDYSPICFFTFEYGEGASEPASYTVTLPAEPVGYTIITEDSTTVTEGEIFTFTVTLAEGYEGTPVVKANGTGITAQNGAYVVTVTSNVEITVEGITKKTYTVTLPIGSGFTVSTDQSTTVAHGETFTFTVEIAEGYEGTPVVKANGSEVAVRDGSYTITVTGDVAIEVSGIAQPFEGYAVEVSADKTITSGETAAVELTVKADEAEVYNAYDLTLTYDTAVVNYDDCVAANAEDELTVEAADGTIRIMGYGPDKAVGTSPVTLTFTGKAVGSADVKITAAKVDIGEHAISNDAPDAATLDDTTVITVTGYTVELDTGLKADTTVAKNGVDYVFYPTDADNYTYTVKATIGEETFTVAANADGSFTIPGDRITGNITLTAVLSPKEYDVILNGEDVSGNKKATYNTDYVFTVDEKPGYTYSVAVKINNAEYDGFVGNTDGKYTIPGSDISGPIVITVTKTAITGGQVTVTKPGYVTGDDNATKGQDYTFTVPEEEGYTYGDVKVTVDGTDISAQVQKNEDGSYTIPGAYVTGTVVIEVPRVSGVNVDVASYITLDEGNVMYLVTASGTIAEGSAAKYDGQNMYWSEKYEAYAWLVVSTASLEDMKAEAEGKVAVGAGSAAGEIAYAGDVNGTNVIDINDAQLTYDMYNAKYADFTEVSMLKFLCADMNGSKNVNVEDAAAVVAAIQ